MSLGFTPEGLEIQTYQEIYDELAAGYREIYGPDINLDPDSPDGQRIAIEAKARLDLQSFAANLYAQFDPDFSIGEVLNKIIKLTGIARQPASRSQVDVTITTDRALTLPAGYAVEDDLNQIWITTSDQSLINGANTVTLVAEDFGAVEADPDTITEPVTVIIGVQSVTNPSAATVGRDEETDVELRVRRNRSLQSSATSTVGGLFTAIGDLPGVTDLAVYENDEDTADVTRNIDPHTIWLIVEGGEVADIVEAMVKNKTGGTGVKGSVTGTYIETLYKPDGTEYTITHGMAFDRPTGIPLYVNLTVEGTDGATVDTDAVKDAIAARELSIAEPLKAGQLYSEALSVADNYTVTLLEISDDNVTFTDGRLDPGFDGVFTIDTADITITDIT